MIPSSEEELCIIIAGTGEFFSGVEVGGGGGGGGRRGW